MSVINVKKNELQKLGYKDFADWNTLPDNVYIGRNMSLYVPGATKSKWANPFSAKKYGRDGCIDMYRQYLLETPKLLNQLGELKNKSLGCWCKPEACHGDILLQFLELRELERKKRIKKKKECS
jgi:hypothetical protein